MNRTAAKTVRPSAQGNPALADWIFRAVVWIVLLGIIGVVFYPLIRMAGRLLRPESGFGLDPIAAILSAEWFLPLVGNTVLVVTGGSILAVIVASILAWLNERTTASLGVVGDLLPLLPFFLPPVAMAIGWVLLAVPDIGFLNILLGAAFGEGAPSLDIFTLPGLIFVYSLFMIPYVYVLVSAGLRNLDPALEEASLMSGAGTLRTLFNVTLPAVWPAVISGFLLTIIVGLWVFSVPAIVASGADVDILSVRIIRLLRAIYPPDYVQAITLSFFMLFAIGLVWILHQKILSGGNFARVSGKSGSSKPYDLGHFSGVARGLTLLYLLITSVLPLVAIAFVSLQPFWSGTFDISNLSLRHYNTVLFVNPVTQSAMQNSLLLGIAAGFVGMLAAGLVSLQAQRLGTVGRGFLEGVTKLPAALSNIVLGVAFLIAFSGPPFNLAGTLVLLLIAYVIIHLPQASIAASAAAEQVGPELREASLTAGAGEFRTMMRVEFPLMVPGLVNGWSLLFVLTVGELAVSSLLAGTSTPVIGFVLLDIWEQGTFGTLAAMAVIMVAMSGTTVGLGLWLARRWGKSWR